MFLASKKKLLFVDQLEVREITDMLQKLVRTRLKLWKLILFKYLNTR